MKGTYNGNCNRTACQQPGAKHFNHSTEKYYCQACAELINQGNKEFKTAKGHDLCTEWRYLKPDHNDKYIVGILTVGRVDGSKDYIQKITRDKAVEQLQAMKVCFPGLYDISGSHILDGSINLVFSAKGKNRLLNSLTFNFIPDEQSN